MTRRRLKLRLPRLSWVGSSYRIQAMQTLNSRFEGTMGNALPQRLAAHDGCLAYLTLGCRSQAGGLAMSLSPLRRHELIRLPCRRALLPHRRVVLMRSVFSGSATADSRAVLRGPASFVEFLLLHQFSTHSRSAFLSNLHCVALRSLRGGSGERGDSAESRQTVYLAVALPTPACHVVSIACRSLGALGWPWLMMFPLSICLPHILGE